MLRNNLCYHCGMPKPNKQSRAEYFRDYRATVKPIGERQAFRDGVNHAVKFLREKIGGRAVTGYQMATALERAGLESDTAEAKARQDFVRSLGG